MSFADRLKAREQDAKKKLETLAVTAERKADVLREKADAKRRADDLERALRAKASSEAEYHAELFRESEIKRKTKDYWELDQQNERALIAPHFPSYFGEHVGDRDAWVPDGPGHFLFQHRVVLEGTFRQGVIHGTGVLRLEDGRMWEGEFMDGKIHGVGVVTDEAGKQRNAIARDHVVVCYQDELQEGKQVELQDATMRVSAQMGLCGKVYATIMFHVKGWKYRCRFHEEVKPRDRDVIFSSLLMFRVLHHLPQIYVLSRFGIEADTEPRYDYFADVYGAGKLPKLGIAGGRRTAEMRPLQAIPLKAAARLANKTTYRENVYESHMVGIGAAEEEEEIARKKEMKKQQFTALIEKRRADAEAERLKAIEEEQARITAEDLAKVKAKAAEREEEKLRHAEELKTALRETAQAFDAAESEGHIH